MELAYGIAWARLEKLLKALLEQIEAAQARGEVVSAIWLKRQVRFERLMQQVNREVLRLAESSATQITEGQRVEIARGIADSTKLMSVGAEQAGVSIAFDRISIDAVEALVGTLGDGTPLDKVLKRYGRQSARAIQQGLIEGVTLGENPLKVASRVKASFGGNLNKARLTARTEQLRAYRIATLENYQANSDVISGWRWTCSHSRRTCLACLYRDGKFYPLKKPMPSHPACRCTMRPVIKGIPEVQRQTGTEWFATQPDEIKRSMMGPKVFSYYESGLITLSDFVGEKRSKDWGTTTYQRSLKEILASR